MDSSTNEFWHNTLLQIGVSVTNKEKNGKQTNTDEMDCHYELFNLDLHHLQRYLVSASVCWTERINPFIHSGIFYLHSLDQSISNIRGVWLFFIMTSFYSNTYLQIGLFFSFLTKNNWYSSYSFKKTYIVATTYIFLEKWEKYFWDVTPLIWTYGNTCF